MSKRVYLCGPIADTTWDVAAQGWRKEVFDALPESEGFEVFSPMRGKEFLSKYRREKLGTNAYEDMPISSTKGILTRDKNDVRTADLIFANFIGATSRSIGSCVEFGWADAWNIPIILCMEDSGNPHEHLFIRGMPGYVLNSLDKGIALTKLLLTPGL